MATIPYVIGESGVLGFPVNEYDGSPIDPAGLGCRLTIYQDGPDLHLIGTWESGPVDLRGRVTPPDKSRARPDSPAQQSENCNPRRAAGSCNAHIMEPRP